MNPGRAFGAIIAALLLMLPTGLLAQEYAYTTSDDTITITLYSGAGGDVTIPDTIDGLPVTKIGDFAFYNDSSVTSVTVASSVSVIGSSSFEGCLNLTNVTIPDSVSAIGVEAFARCSSLTDIAIDSSNTAYHSEDGVLFNKDQTTLIAFPPGKSGFYAIPDTVVSIGFFAFTDCRKLTDVTIGNGVTSIDSYRFEDCINLSSVILGSGVTNIARYAFKGCTSLSSFTVHPENSSLSSLDDVVFDKNQTTLVRFPPGRSGGYSIPNHITVIASSAFYGCADLTDVTIPNSVITIGGWSFSQCDSLTSVTIPESVTSIGDAAFFGSNSLREVYFRGVAPTSIGSNVLTDTASSTVYYWPGTMGWEISFSGRSTAPLFTYTEENGTIIYTKHNAPSSSVNIPGEIVGLPVVEIADSAFAGLGYLTEVSIPDTVANIGANAFNDCGLISLEIPNSVTNIGANAFASCHHLRNATVPATLAEVPVGMFSGCNSLTNVVVPDGVTKIGNNAFRGCDSLGTVDLPDAVTSIGWYVFESCSGLTNLTIPNSVTNIGTHTFQNCSSLTDVSIPEGVTKISDSLFVACYSLTNVALPNSLEEIDARAFVACTNLPSLIIPEGVTSIGDSAFASCYSLSTLVIPDSVMSIGDSAFDRCKSLTNVVIPEGVTSIGYRQFASCENLVSVTIPQSVTSIGESAFSECDRLPTVTIPSGVTMIDTYAFFSCTNLTNITVDTDNQIYSSVDGVLFDKTRTVLIRFPQGRSEDYQIPEGTTTIAMDAFRYSVIITSVTVPESVVVIGDGAFRDCQRLKAVHFQGDPPVDVGFNVFAGSYPNIFYLPEATGWGAAFAGLPTAQLFDFDVVDDSVIITGLNGTYGSATIPASITGLPVVKIADRAFFGNTNVVEMLIPNSVTNIGVSAFERCDNLLSVVLPESVSNISELTFRFCTQLASVSIPESVETIGVGAFVGCWGLPDLVVPDGVSVIGDFAFSICTNLSSVEIGGGVSELAPTAFSNCKNLSAINVDAANSVYASVDGVVFSKDQSMLITFPAGKSGPYSIPSGVSRIGEHAFAFNAGLTNMVVPDTVIALGPEAFSHCSNLESIALGKGINRIEKWTFASCTSLEGVTIPTAVTNIGFGAFEYCTSLSNVYFPYGLTLIDDRAFRSCAALRSVTIPATVDTLGEQVFDQCYGLNSVYFQGDTPASVGSNILSGSNNSTVYYLSGTIGWRSSFGRRPTVLWDPVVSTGDSTFGMQEGRFGFTIEGAEGLEIVVEATDRLTNPDWIPVSTNMLSGGTSYFSDPSWLEYQNRIYRLRGH